MDGQLHLLELGDHKTVHAHHRKLREQMLVRDSIVLMKPVTYWIAEPKVREHLDKLQRVPSPLTAIPLLSLVLVDLGKVIIILIYFLCALMVDLPSSNRCFRNT